MTSPTAVEEEGEARPATGKGRTVEGEGSKGRREPLKVPMELPAFPSFLPSPTEGSVAPSTTKTATLVDDPQQDNIWLLRRYVRTKSGSTAGQKSQDVAQFRL